MTARRSPIPRAGGGRRWRSRRARSRRASTAGSAAAITWRGRRRGASASSDLPGGRQGGENGAHRGRLGRAEHGLGHRLRRQAVRRQHVGRQQAAALARQGGHRAQHAGRAIGGAQVAQRLRLPRRPAGARRPPPGRRRCRAGRKTSRPAWRSTGSASASRASISASRSARASAPASSAAASGVATSCVARRALHHLAPPVQPDQRQRRLVRRLARPRQLVVEGVERQQRRAPVRRREQRGEEAVRVVPADKLDQWVHRGPIRCGGAAIATRWRGTRGRASLTRSAPGPGP